MVVNTVVVYVNQKPVRGVIDSAAQVTVMDRECWLSVMSRQPEGESVLLKQADGNATLQAIIVQDVVMQVGDFVTKMAVFVTKLGDKLLLGLDFLLTAGAIVNLRDQTLLVCGSLVPIELMSGGDQAHTLAVVTKELYIPPGVQSEIKVSTAGNGGGIHLLEPAGKWSALNIPVSVIDLDRNSSIPVYNLSAKAVKIHAGSVLGRLECLSAGQVCEFPSVNSVSSCCRLSELPEHLIKMFEKSSEGLTEAQTRRVKSLLLDYQDIFSTHDLDIGCYTGIEHRIDTRDALPIRQRMRRTPLHFQDEEGKHLQKLLDIGVIVPSNSEWAANPVMITKRDGSMRYALDFRALNKVTVKDAFPLPLIEDCFDALEGVKYMSGLDMASSYYQVAIAEEDQPKTAFVTRFGLYQHTRVAFPHFRG